MDHNCDARDSKIEDIPEFIRQNLIDVKSIWRDSCEAIKELKDNDYNKHLILILTDLEEEILENREKFSKNQFAKNYFTTQIKQYLEETKKSAGEPSAKSLWAKPISTQLKFTLEALNSGSEPKFELKDVLYFVKIIQIEIISVESLECLLNLLVTEILKEEMNLEELKFIVNTIIIMFIERGYYVKTLENLLHKQLYLFQDHWERISKFGLYLYGGLIYGSPKYNEEVYSEDEDYRIALKQYYDSLGLKDRIFLMKKIYVEPPKKYKVIFKLSNFALANSQSLNIGNVYFYIPQIHGKITRSIFRDDRHRDESSHIVEFDKEIQEFEVISKSIYYVAVDIEGNDFYSMKDQAVRTVERAVSVFLKKDTAMKKTNNNEIQIILNDYIICNDLGEGVFQHFYTSNSKEFDIPDQIYTDRIGQWISSKNLPNKSVETWLTAIELYRKSVESVQSSDALLYSWYSLEHFINKSEKITMRLPKEFGKPVYEEWYNTNNNNISVLQLLLAIVSIKSNLHTLLITFADNLARKGLPWDRYSVSDEILNIFVISRKCNGSIVISASNFVENFQLIFDDFEQKNTQADKYISKIRGHFIDHKICFNKIKKTIIDVKNDVYNIYRIRNMLVHSSNTKSKLLEYYSKRNKEHSLRLLLEIRKHLLTTESDPEIQPINTYFDKMIIDANVAFEAVANNDMDKFRKWIIQ